MGRLLILVQKFFEDESGVSLTEYALMLVLIATVTVAAISSLGTAVVTAFQNMSSLISGS